MRLTDDKDKLLEFAQNSQLNILTEIDFDCDSYWQDVDSNVQFMEEYGFETPIELLNKLSKYIHNEELGKIVAVSIFKNHQIASGSKKKALKEDDSQLPEYIYNF